MTMRVCIYTAICGDCDDLKPQPGQTINTDFVCFTDARKLPRVPPWTVIQSRRRMDLHPRMRAKYFKIQSHRVFPGGWPDSIEAPPLNQEHSPYDYLIWIDGSGQIRDANFVDRVISRVGSSGWAMFNHPNRECIYDEAVFSMTMQKYHKLPIREQVESYRAEGYPAGNGLMACTLIARDARRVDLNGINESWWQENLR